MSDYVNYGQASQRAEPEDVTLDVYLMNGHKITLSILSTDQTDDVLEVSCGQYLIFTDHCSPKIIMIIIVLHPPNHPTNPLSPLCRHAEHRN